ncbi:HNH endonuclease signature motif containing protein [Xanthomonas campestris pv. campestris]|uniref:HNH endonuclease n=1 Tax=Xanthomonas campestris TaxID=339 RepID=UPI002B363F7F|nr:HNH endonuclease signature motif containing protein [Xanthomonas campestris pv. campestris]WVL67926.1 HNH endonuclease signature motif containing protein [Xanthomonas campestris pv. campestris]
MTRLQFLRALAFHAQQGRCCYCEHDMWLSSPAELELAARFARRYQCTAEHLMAQQDGGKDTRGNIAAACWTCNQRRHRRKKLLTPEAFKALVRRRVAAGKWWPSADSATAEGSYRTKPASKGPKKPPDISMLH